MNKNSVISNLSPAHIIIMSFFILIICGTFLLSLPYSRTQSIALIDLFFTATSATCVAGLFTIPLTSFTWIGKVIILLLIQIGALGLTTMSLFILSFFMELGLATKSIVGQLLEVESWQDIKKMLVFITITTFTIEIIGIFIFLIIFLANYPVQQALFYSLFHSIASFCNAGISFLQDTTGQHLEQYSTNYTFIYTTSMLTFLGGLGFFTFHEILLYLHSCFTSEKPFRFSLHSKIILYATTTIFLITTTLFWILEHTNSLSTLSTPLAIAHTLFHAISLKSCGFFIAPFDQFQTATLFFILLVAFIGSSSGSTGSGIKITTFVIFLCTIKATLQAREDVEIFGRRIAFDQVYKAITIIALSIGWILLTIFCLLISESEWNFFEIFFETLSAFSNLGLSLKGSNNLSFFGKLIIITTMFIGRIGSLTFILGLKLRKKENNTHFSYPEERVILS